MLMQLTLMREVQTIAPALTMGLCGLSVDDDTRYYQRREMFGRLHAGGENMSE